MKIVTIIITLLVSLPALCDVYLHPSVRPCDDKLASELTYSPTPVYAPGTPKMPFKCDGEVKVYEITAEVVMSIFDQTYEPGPIYTWGYNGSNPGPVMEFIEGEKIRVLFKNNLPDPTVIHWHGLEVPYLQDGASGHSMNPIKPGESFVYEWQVHQNGTYMYHSGHDLAKQLSMGLVGFLIIHPKKAPQTIVDHDILLFMQMWALPPHSIFPDVMEMMMFNYFTFNGKSAPYIPSPVVLVGDKVRARFANMSMMEHPVHLHGHTWKVVATGAGDNAPSTYTHGNTILVPTAQPIDVIIDEVTTPGEWMFHCHLPHHVTNNMDVDTIPGEPMFMENGGMHLSLIVHQDQNTPGYKNPLPPEGGGGHNHGGGHGGAAPSITTYDGYIKLTNGTKLDTTLELYKAQEGDQWRKLKAYLKVYLSKDEFLVYHYDQVKFNFETSLMALESEDKAVTLSNLSFSDQGDMGALSGDASIDFGNLKGDVFLETRDPEMNSIRLKNNLSISGEYSGMCGQKQTLLQIVSARDFKNEDSNNNNPLPRFAIAGNLGILNAQSKQVEASVKEGLYDPFKGEISLKLEQAGIIKPMTCKTIISSNKISGLSCGDCDFKISSTLSPKIISDTSPTLSFSKDNSPKVSEMSVASDLTGNFSGLLILTESNLTMPLTFKSVAKRYATNAMVLTKNYISGVLTLGSGKSSMNFKVKERQFLDSSAEVNQGKNKLLLQTNGNLELVVEKWTKDTITGTAYHKSYGELGSFSVSRSGKVGTVPATPIPLSGIDGSYQNDAWTLRLESSELEDGNSINVYSPLHIKGELRNGPNGQMISIINGSYDFKLGSFFLETSDGRLIKGYLNRDEIELLIPSKAIRRAKYLNLADSRVTLKRINP